MLDRPDNYDQMSHEEREKRQEEFEAEVKVRREVTLLRVRTVLHYNDFSHEIENEVTNAMVDCYYGSADDRDDKIDKVNAMVDKLIKPQNEQT